jgi:excisionase family DNA binding protein
MIKKANANDLLSLTDAAERYGFSSDYFRRLAEKGRLQARKVGRQWLTTADAVESFLETREERGVYKKHVKRR